MPLRFFLNNDVGTRIAEGCRFTDGCIGLRMVGKTPPLIWHASVDAMLHRHALPPESVEWIDEPA